MTLWSPEDERRYRELEAKKRLAEEARRSKIDALLLRTSPQGTDAYNCRMLKSWLMNHADDIVGALLPFCTRQGREER